MNELGGEKIDIIEWSEDPSEFVRKALSPAKVLDVVLDETEHKATIEVTPDQLSLAIGKGGQNVRLAAKLTGWKIDIKGAEVPETEGADNSEGEDFKPLTELASEEVVQEVAIEETATETENS
jgi:N utilization substance protein A